MRIRKFLTVLLSVALVMGTSAVAFADTAVISKTSGTHTFTSDWSESTSRYVDGSYNVLTYGFNRFLIHEDTAYAYSNGAEHYSRITRNGMNHVDGPDKYANEWSDLEITHYKNAVPVSYYNMWLD